MKIQPRHEKLASDIATKWADIAAASNELRNCIAEVQILLRALNSCTKMNAPPPNPSSVRNDSQTVNIREDAWKAFDVKNWKFNEPDGSFRGIWSEWKEGTESKPSVQWMEQTYGPRGKWLNPSQHISGAIRSKIVQEIDKNLGLGRSFAEVCQAGEAVASREGSLYEVARLIILNETSHMPTFYI